MNTDHDQIFTQLNGLKWFPWVGNEYFSIPQEHRLLIIGESHYSNGTSDSISMHESKTFTKEVIEEMAIDRCYYQTRIFQNLHKALFRNDSFNSGNFWHQVSFYNFIQRVMNTNKERPSYPDYFGSWKVCFELLQTLKPSKCLFIGTMAADSFIHAVSATEYKHTPVIWEDYISNSYAKTANFITSDGKNIELIFIRHTSSMFSWNRWNLYLLKKMSSTISWLENASLHCEEK